MELIPLFLECEKAIFQYFPVVWYLVEKGAKLKPSTTMWYSSSYCMLELSSYSCSISVWKSSRYQSKPAIFFVIIVMVQKWLFIVFGGETSGISIHNTNVSLFRVKKLKLKWSRSKFSHIILLFWKNDIFGWMSPYTLWCFLESVVWE